MYEDDQRIMLRQAFERTLGYWDPVCEQVLDTSPLYFEAWLDASITHLWASGVRTHIRAAFRHGSTIEEIIEVLELTSVLGTQSVTFGVPILLEEVAKHKNAA